MSCKIEKGRNDGLNNAATALIYAGFMERKTFMYGPLGKETVFGEVCVYIPTLCFFPSSLAMGKNEEISVQVM